MGRISSHSFQIAVVGIQTIVSERFGARGDPGLATAGVAASAMCRAAKLLNSKVKLARLRSQMALQLALAMDRAEAHQGVVAAEQAAVVADKSHQVAAVEGKPRPELN